jgi:PKD repeat protein
MTTTHEFRTVGAYQVSLTVTDSRGAQATTTQSVTVAASTPPTAAFVMSPTPVGINQDVFFNAEQSRATLPRTIVNYGWNFGDGRTATGITVSRSFSTAGTYNIILTVTDDAGAVSTPPATLPLTVTNTPSGLAAVLSFSPAAPKVNVFVFFNGSASTAGSAPIASYRFNWGDGTPDDVGPASTQSHAFALVGGIATTYTVRLTVTDTLGRTATITAPVPVIP